MARVARLYLFGGFRLESATGRPVRVAARKGQALIAFLACTPAATATREKLATLFWSDSDSRRARQNLRQVLFALGRDLGTRDGGLLRLQGDKVTLRTDRVRVDVLAFDRDRAGPSHVALERAARRYAGDLLEGLVIDAPLFEEWLSVERARTMARAIECLGALLARHRQAGLLDAAIATANRILEIDSCLEDVHRILMEIYLAKGMRTSALRQYEHCRAVLNRELAVEPDAATTAVYRGCLGPEARVSAAWPENCPPARKYPRGLSKTSPAPAFGVPAPDEFAATKAGDGSSDARRRDLERRLARVGRTARDLAEAASVLGVRCDFAALAEVAGMPGDAALPALDELVDAGLVRTEGNDVEFVHGWHRLALYRLLAGPRLRALHAAAARVTARENADRLPRVHAVLARHLAAAGRLAEALEHELAAAQADIERGARGAARAALHRVLRRARRLGRTPRAASLARRAGLRLAEVAEADGDVAAALRRLVALERAADPDAAPVEQVRLLCALSRVCIRARRAADGHGHARQALRAERMAGAGIWLPAERLLFRAHLLAGGQRRAAERLAARVERARRLGLLRDEIGAAEASAVLWGLRGQFAPADRHLDWALDAAGALDDPRRLAGTLMVAGLVRTWADDPAPAIAALDRARGLATGAGDVIRAHAVLGHRGFALLQAKRLDEAAADLRAAAAAARALGMAAYLPVFTAWLAAVAAAAGDRAAAERHARQAWRAATAANQAWPRNVALRMLARLRATADAPDRLQAARIAHRLAAERRGFGFEAEPAKRSAPAGYSFDRP